ncbi:MAG TPA: hypothetical protein PK299_07925 [Anaerolineales bacterium]|nr:hypothetical protein [Anaerolineales bacterium]
MKANNLRPVDIAWQAIFDKYDILSHDFDHAPFSISAEQIKNATSHFKNTSQREVRILCKLDTRESTPAIFQQNRLFILPTQNGKYSMVKGEGYVDIPRIEKNTQIYKPKLDFQPITATIGNSEMQFLDYAYAVSLVRSFMNDDSLVLTIRGRKYTPRFDFRVGKQSITVESVQTEVDAGYEGKTQVVLVEAKNSLAKNTIIRQLYYPFRQWSEHLKTSKQVYTLFFEKSGNDFSFWQFTFKEVADYNSIELVRSEKFQIVD